MVLLLELSTKTNSFSLRTSYAPVGVVSIQIVKNFVAAGIYLLLRLLLQNAPEQTRLSIIRVRKLRILLSLLAI
ncbi:hypothetical protein DRO66_10000, partial [Candidatus Bathyarchaeota archaeon]